MRHSIPLRCVDVAEAGLFDGTCCTSCHDDEDDLGILLLEIDPPPNRHGRLSRFYLSVCCACYDDLGGRVTRDGMAWIVGEYRLRMRAAKEEGDA